MIRLMVGGAVLLLGAACASGPKPGQMHVSWAGTDTATFSADVRALWCEAPRWLEVIGQRGDTGVGLVVYPAGGRATVAGSYPVVVPVRDSTADSVAGPRPAGAMAVRWFGKDAVEGYEGISGDVTITEGEGTVAGTFRGLLRSVYGEDTLLLEGRFGGVAPATDGIECPAGDSVARPVSEPPAPPG